MYVSYIDYLFEGKNHLSFGYQSIDDPNKILKSNSHGAKSDLQPERYNLRNPLSRILSPGTVLNTD